MEPSQKPVWLRVKLFYLTNYAAGSSIATFLILYYQSVGLSGSQIGLLTGLRPLLVFLVAPLLGGWTDATHRHKQVLQATLLLSGAAALAFVLSSNVAVVFALSLLWTVFVAPVAPLVDNSVIALLGKDKAMFGRQRLWGAVGFAIVAPVAGWLIERMGLLVIFYAYALLVAVAWLVTLKLPIVGTQTRGVASIPKTTSYRQGLTTLIRNPAWAIFVVTVVVIGMGRATGMFLALHLDAMGASAGFVGVVSAVAATSELPFFFFSNRLLKRWGAWGVLVMCVVGSALDLAILGSMPLYWLAVPARILHGASYAMLLVACVSYADELAPPGLGATSQGILAAAQTGLGWGLGGLLAGALYERLGAPQTFFVGAGASFLGLGLLVAGRMLSTRRGQSPPASSR